MTRAARPLWAFLDVGNVLLNEDPLTFLSLKRHAEAVERADPSVTFDRVLARREAHARAGSRWPLYEAVAATLSEAECAAVWERTAREVRARFDELSPLLPGAAEAVEALHSLGYRLGLIANQGPECRARLDALGLLGRFEVVAFSEEVGAAKPDPALFLEALRRAGAEASDGLMVGDRLDNDVAPAAALGMATAWVRWPDRGAKGWRPADPEAVAYLESLDRVAPGGSDAVPTVAVDTLAELPGRLASGWFRPPR